MVQPVQREREGVRGEIRGEGEEGEVKREEPWVWGTSFRGTVPHFVHAGTRRTERMGITGEGKA